MPNEDLHEIKAEPDILHKYIDFDVYYRKQDGRYGLYKKKGASFDPYRVRSRKIPEYLYISLHDKIIQVRDQTKTLNEKPVKEIRKDPGTAKKDLVKSWQLHFQCPEERFLKGLKIPRPSNK